MNDHPHLLPPSPPTWPGERRDPDPPRLVRWACALSGHPEDERAHDMGYFLVSISECWCRHYTNVTIWPGHLVSEWASERQP